ncbi:MBL fold metallo-hydrolase [Kineosporia sp. R_H_3]|uniref:MBL fold metallo-hydrolase n=1 Tax=Kineosporia sp. R_H_3 TaxID=1961848 RepID=UPI001179F32B|nr:MBL fold metallo-hydrolase [Kineosporia sp. R_H_3]
MTSDGHDDAEAGPEGRPERPRVPHQGGHDQENGRRPDDDRTPDQGGPSSGPVPGADSPEQPHPGALSVQIPDDLTFDPPFAMPEPPQWQDLWREIGAGVLVKRHKVMDLNVTLVLGDDRCLVVDTHAHDGYAEELIASIRTVTPLPFVVVNTHAHFDHAFGNAAFLRAQPDVEIWGHEECRRDLEELGELQRRLTVQWMRESERDDTAAAVEAVTIVPPNRTFTQDTTLDLGGRHVVLHHPGRAHTGHDAVVDVPDADVTVVGDIVEEGSPPAFEDSFPLEWAASLELVLPRLRRNVVPGHGDVVDATFVAEQRAQIAEVAEVALTLPAGADDLVLAKAAVRLSIGRQAGFVGLQRALATRG